MQAVRS
nr:unnamed protein product [Callosobruchus chinensis]